MNDSPHKQIRIFGNADNSGNAVGLGHKILRKLKEFMSFNSLPVAGPWSVYGPGFMVVVKSIFGVRDYIDVYVTSGQNVIEKEFDVTGCRMLLFWGHNYERIDFMYEKDSPLFQPGIVACSDGYGEVELVIGNRLLGQFVRCWDAGSKVTWSLSVGIIRSCRRDWFADTYQVRELLAPFDYSKIVKRAASPSDSINIPCRMNAGNKSFSKTLDKITVQVFEYGDLTSQLNWVICAKYNGYPVAFPNSAIFYTANDFARTREYMQGIYRRVRTYDILFDVWYGNNGIYVGACGQNTLHVWRLDEKNNTFVTDHTYQIAGKGYEPADSVPDNYEPIVCGYTKWTVFINRGGYGIVVEDSLTGKITGGNGTDKAIEKTLWNPFEDLLYYWTEEPGEVVPTYKEAMLYLPECYVRFYATGWWCSCDYSYPGLAKISDTCAPYWECNLGLGSAYTCTKDFGGGAVITYMYLYGGEGGISVDKFVNTFITIHIHTVNRTTYGKQMIDRVGIKGEKSTYVEFDRGYTEYRSRSYSKHQNCSSAQYTGTLSSLCTSTRTAFTLKDWNVTPLGIAYDVSAEKVDWCKPGINSANKGGTFGEIYLGCDEWEAYLISGIDAKGNSIEAPVGAFRFVNDSKFMLVAYKDYNFKYIIPDETGDRLFFQYTCG